MKPDLGLRHLRDGYDHETAIFFYGVNFASRVLSGHRDEGGREAVINEVQSGIEQAEQVGFDIDEVTQADLEEPYRPNAVLDMQDLDRVIRYEPALPPGITAEVMATAQYAYSAPGMSKPIRVTTNPEFYEEHAESVELWSPGFPLFPEPEYSGEMSGTVPNFSIRERVPSGSQSP